MAEQALRTKPKLAEQTAFHSQQAMEKALKAFLTAHDQLFPKTHNLERLVSLCQNIDKEFVDFQPAARILNPYATQFRYPGGLLEPEISDAQEALQLASKIVRFVANRLFPHEPD